MVRFKLPAAIERGEASLGVKFLGGAVETITRPLPIVLKKLNVEFYPEGGDLAADLPNRVYFQVRTPLGKPADLKGRLFEDGKPLPVAVETLHDDKEPGVNQGMGRFEFTPKAGKKYELQHRLAGRHHGPRRPAGGEGRRRGAERAGRRGRGRPADQGGGAQQEGTRPDGRPLLPRPAAAFGAAQEGRDRGGAEPEPTASAASAA